jgi:AmiR/NasT family two-component response regulator
LAEHGDRVLALAVTLARQLRIALDRRAVIDQAIGILRVRHGLTAAESLQALRWIGLDEHIGLAEVSQRTVDEAVAAAREK